MISQYQKSFMNSKIFNKLLKNLSYAFVAQGISLFLSIIMNFIVPKLLDVEGFAYWQLFLFYVSYAGVFSFGFVDGIYLKLGGVSYDSLNKKEIGGLCRRFSILVVIIAFFLFILTTFINSSLERKIIIYIAIIYSVIYCINMCFGCIFQACNETKVYSLSVILDKIIFLITIFVFLFIKIDNFVLYILGYFVGKMLSCLYMLYKAKEMVFVPSQKIKMVKIWEYVCIGLPLLFANLASSMILGVSRFIIDYRWGIEVFGKFSFSLTLTNFFLLFIGQLSMVLFPALRCLKTTTLETLYQSISIIIEFVLLISFIGYYPIKLIIGAWLPQYTDSINYMVIMLIITYYDGKMNLLGNTYLKVMRKEKVMLNINVFIVCLSTIISFVGAYLFNNINIVIVSMILSVVIRFFLTDWYLKKHLVINNKFSLSSIILILFVLLNWYMGIVGWFIYILIILMYVIVKKDKFIESIKKVRCLE